MVTYFELENNKFRSILHSSLPVPVPMPNLISTDTVYALHSYSHQMNIYQIAQVGEVECKKLPAAADVLSWIECVRASLITLWDALHTIMHEAFPYSNLTLCKTFYKNRNKKKTIDGSAIMRAE